MNLHVLGDLHLEFRNDGQDEAQRLMQSLHHTPADVVVLAGDLAQQKRTAR